MSPLQTLNDRKNLRSQMEHSVTNGISLGVSVHRKAPHHCNLLLIGLLMQGVASSKHRSARPPRPPVHVSIQHDVETHIEDQFKSSTLHAGSRDSYTSMGYSGTHSEKELQSPITPVTPVGVAFLDLHAERQKEGLLDVDVEKASDQQH